MLMVAVRRSLWSINISLVVGMDLGMSVNINNKFTIFRISIFKFESMEWLEHWYGWVSWCATWWVIQYVTRWGNCRTSMIMDVFVLRLILQLWHNYTIRRHFPSRSFHPDPASSLRIECTCSVPTSATWSGWWYCQFCKYSLYPVKHTITQSCQTTTVISGINCNTNNHLNIWECVLGISPYHHRRPLERIAICELIFQ